MSLLNCPCVTLLFLMLLGGDCLQMKPNLCDPSCSEFPTPTLTYQRGVRYTYRYSTTISTSLQGSNAGRNGLALDCVVDIDVVSKCHLMMQIRNPQIKRLSPQKEHSVQRLKSLREALERTRLKFSLQGGKVTALCLQEGEQVWALNVKRAFLSMLQTSRTASKEESDNETDVHGTCPSRYERRGPLTLKMRDLKQCQQSRLTNFWPHSVALTEDTSVQSQLHCVQRHGLAVMEEVNCTEDVSIATWSDKAGLVRTRTVSTLLLLRAQPGTASGADLSAVGALTDLQFEEEGAAPVGEAPPPHQASQTVRTLCSLASDPQTVSQQFLQLAFQLRLLSLSQLRALWQEAAFKCRNDWQPLLDALPACGSESCVTLLMELMKSRELEEEQAHSFLTTIALVPNPTPKVIHSINALVKVPELRSKALLAGSSLVYQLCQRFPSPCSDLPQVRAFLQTIEVTLRDGCDGEEHARVQEILYALKSIGNAGLSAAAFIPLLSSCAVSRSAALELRLAAVQAFRRFACSADRSVLLQLYRSSQEDPEVRIAAYQQLMRCPDPDVFEVVKATLRDETSSQVGSFVWSHLTNVLRSEDPMKQTLIESLPDDIISRDFEAEFLKYSSYSDYTIASGMGITNVETSVVFSPKSFVPRSASANLTAYFHGRASNLLEVDLHVDNAEPFLKSIFGHGSHGGSTGQSQKQPKEARRGADDGHGTDKDMCLTSASTYLNQARAMLFARRKMEGNVPKCQVGMKVFGNELSVFSCEDLYNHINHFSLSAAGLAVRLLKGQEVQLNHRAVLMTEELVLPSLSGLPIKLGINMTSLLSLHMKGNANYRDMSHFSLTGYIKPNAYVAMSARMGVDGALGQASVHWASELRSSTSLDGSVQMQEGQDLRATLNTPEDIMDILSFSSQVFQISGDHREEIKGPKSRMQKTSCTPKTWSKMVGWQLCSNASYPLDGVSLPPSGPVYFSLRLLKLDRGLHYYLLEAAYSLLPQRGTWLPREASLHLLLATPQSSIPRDMSVDFAFNAHRLLLRLTHPMKTILLQGQLEREKTKKVAKVELLIDSVHYYIMGLVDTQNHVTEQRTRYHVEAKMAANGNPMILSANVTRGHGRKTSFSAILKNVFRETASLSVALERRRDSSSRQYSVEAELLLLGVVGSRMLGLMEQKDSLWSSALRLKYGLGGDARHLRQECHTSQRLRSERNSNRTYVMRADHEFYCTNTAPINHKIHLRHEESPQHVKSSLDASYGKHWDEINNKRTFFLSQSYKNQSTQDHTSYALEFSLQLPEKNLNYRTQLLHSHLRKLGSEGSTHLKVNYNNLMPLVAGLHWRSPPKDELQKKWEGTFNMDTPWLYVYTAHKLNQPHRHTLQLTSELTTSKLMTIRNLVLEGFYRDRGREKEAQLELYTPSVTYLRGAGWAMVGKRNAKASCSLSSLWTPPLRGDISLEASKISHTLHMASSFGKLNASLSAALHTVDKNLKKRQVMLRMNLSEPRSRPTELEFDGVVEELRKDKKMYQKTAMLQLRQPFQSFPQSLLIRETFTVDVHKGLYILESRGGFHSNKEVVHTLTVGYQPLSPFVCSALIFPFSSEILPSDSEICVTISNNQTHKDVQGRMRVGSKERLNFSGQVQMNPLKSSHQAIKVRANISHQLQLPLPSSAIVEGDIGWKTKNNTDFDYLAQGRLRVERQECQLSVRLNGSSGRMDLHSSLRHPFKSKIPKTLEAKATADISATDGRGRSSLRVRVDGKDRAMLDAHMFHTIHRGDRALGMRVNLSQSFVPTLTDLQANMAANMSSDSVSLHGSYTQGHESLLAQVKGSLKNTGGLQLAVSGDLRHSMTSLAHLPSALGLDGALGQSDALIEGQLRVRVMESLYSVELRHQEDLEDAQVRNKEEGIRGEKTQVTRDRLCFWSGAENLCLNMSRELWAQGMGEVHTQLSHSFQLLNATGVPTTSKAEVRWSQTGGLLSALAELQAGSEHLRTELNGGRTNQLIPRWEIFSKLQHRVKALSKRGVAGSMQVKAHYQVDTQGLDAGLVLSIEEQRVIDILLAAGSKNSTTTLAASLWQQVKLLQGVIPTSSQMNCTGDATVHRLSAHCSGHVAGRPTEVRAFRSYRPDRLCWGASLAHPSLSARAKSCSSPDGQRELRANLTHSSALLLAHLGLPTKAGFRLLLRPGPRRWALGMGAALGPWVMDLNVALRAERDGLLGWHGLLEYGGRGSPRKAEVTGRARLESWCHIWADVGLTWDSVSSSLLLSMRCKGVGRLIWEHIRVVDEGLPHRTSLTIHGKAGNDGLQGVLALENQQDSLHCILSVLLKDRKADVGWTLQHQWASLIPTMPQRLALQGSGQLCDTSFSGSAGVSLNARSARVDVASSWETSASLRVVLQQDLSPGVPGALAVSAASSAGRARFEMESDSCAALLLLASQQRRGVDKWSGWSVFVHQRCVLLKALLPPQTSLNVSLGRSGCSTDLNVVLQADDEQKGTLTLAFACQPRLSLSASVQHSIETIQNLGIPTHGALILNVSAAHQPGVKFGLEVGQCYFRGNLGKTKPLDADGNLFSYAVDVTNYCPALQETSLPITLALQGSLSILPCRLTVTSSLSADDQDLTLALGWSCRSPHLSGTLAHTFPWLSSRGFPQTIAVEASAPGGPPEQSATLSINAGMCHIRADRVRRGARWLWALRSQCPMLQAHLNGSVWQESQGLWVAAMETSLEGKSGFLRVNARAWPEWSVEGEFNQDLPALRGLPEHGRVTLTSRAAKQRYNAEALVQMDKCALGASGAVISHAGLQGSLQYHNNCTAIQEWGSPDKMHTAASLHISPSLAKSQLSMAIDEAEMHALIAVTGTKDRNEASLYFNHTVPLLKKLGLTTNAEITMSSGHHGNRSYYYLSHSGARNQRVSQEMTVERTPETLRLRGHFLHALSYLRKLRVPGNNSVQVELGSSEGKALTLQSHFGDQRAGLTLKMRGFPSTKEIRGSVWHSWVWLQDRGVPLHTEGLCSVQGTFSQLQSRAQVTVDGHKLLVSGLNVSAADGRVAMMLSYSPPPLNQTWAQFGLNAVLTGQFRGPLRSISGDIHCQDWRVRVLGDIGGWGSQGGSKEARVTFKHTVQGQTSPVLQVEAWGRFGGSQLRCSMAVNPELSSSLALIIQGQHLPHSKDLMVKVVQNIPKILIYLPSQLNVRTQMNQSQSSVGGLVEVLSGRRRLWALGELAATNHGYTQALELKHSYPQLKPLARSVAVKTVYEVRNWSYHIQHGAVWGNQEFNLSGLYATPPALEMGNQTLKVKISCIPRLTNLEVTLERWLLGRLDSVSLGWMRHGQLEQVRALSLWSRSEETNETRLELRQPFSSMLSQLTLHTLSHNSQSEQQSHQQTHVSWDSVVPGNVSLNLSKQWQLNSSRGQACAIFSSQQMALSPIKGCISVGQEGNSYLQNSELRLDGRSVKQSMKYQRSTRGMHSLQVNVALDKVSPAPCPSHTLLAKLQTNLRDRLEHTVLVGLCPPQPTLAWSGTHKVNSGDELLYTQSRLSVTGRPHQCSLTLALTNSSTAQRTNITLSTESRVGNWSLEVGGSSLSWPKGSGVQLQARLDGGERVWLNGSLEDRCVRTAAGYANGTRRIDDITVAACVGTNGTLSLGAQRGDHSGKVENLGNVSVGTANQRLRLTAGGSLESLFSVEARLHYLSSQIQRRLLERIKTVQLLLAEFRRQSKGSEPLLELSAVPLHISQRAEALLVHKDGGLWALWQRSAARRLMTHSLPRWLRLLQQASLLGQQELRRPLATLAGVYQDVRGQKLEAQWKDAVSLWSDGLLEPLPAVMGNPQLRPLAQAGAAALSLALDVAGQHTYQWLEARLALVLSGLRKHLSSVYKFSPRESSVSVSVPLPQLPWSRVSEAGLVEILLEEWLLRPLQTLASVRPTAELYRLKRKIMDSPFIHRALLVADQFVVTFDGRLHQLPGPCPLLLSQDVSADPAFTLLLGPDPRTLLLMGIDNNTVSIQHNGQVKTNCNEASTRPFYNIGAVSVRRGANVVQVSNQNGVSVSCDLASEVCSLTLDGWLHGRATGLMGTNDNEAGSDTPLPDGSQADNEEEFLSGWQLTPHCLTPPATSQSLPKASMSPVACDFLFASPDSPLSSCFRVVDPHQFLMVCEGSGARDPCRLASAFAHLCQQNYIPLEVPVQCLKV